MAFSLSIQEKHYESLIHHLFQDRSVERGAYLLCSLSSTEGEKRLLVQDLIKITDAEIETATATELVIKQISFLRAIKRAARKQLCFVLVHSHPEGHLDHSEKDDSEETKLFRTAYIRIHSEEAVHGSIVISNPFRPRGRVWLRDGTTAKINRIRVIGNRFLFFDLDGGSQSDLTVFDRQVLAFGAPIQNLLRRLHVAVVGFGGTGSAVYEQIVRLGVGKISICDPQLFDVTNTNRVYGSGTGDQALRKVDIAARLAANINVPTEVETLFGYVNDLEVARKLREADIIFGCTDDEAGRSILTKLAAYYLTPVFDMGVKIDSEDGVIKSVRGRVTTLVPGAPCLFCRGIITGEAILSELLQRTFPEDYQRRLQDGYVAELPGTAPSVIMFTSAVASAAVCEMLHRLTGYMGADRVSTEIILRFDESKISTNSRTANPDCWCAAPSAWGAGDVDPFLDLTWPSE